MKKLLAGFTLLGAVLLTGCSEGEINYDEKLRPVSEVEEIIADQLEVENPDLDLEVRIYEEVED